MHDLCPSIRRPALRLGLLLGGVLGGLLAAGQPAGAGLTFTNDFEASWATNPNQAMATADIVAVEKEYSTDFSNNINVSIKFGWGDNNGTPVPGGATGGPISLDGFTLAQTKGFYSTAVGLQPTNADLATANAHLPATYTNPNGSSIFGIGNAEFKALTGGALPGYAGDDSSVGFATNFCNPGSCTYDYSGGVPGANAIDFTAVAEHEIAHAMGRLDQAFVDRNPPFLTPLDFFKYDISAAGACTNTLDPTFVTTCFSMDGGATNPLGRQFANVCDSGDWGNALGDSYNAFINPGLFASVSSADITEICALGWNDCAKAVTAPEPGTLALLGSSLLGFAALRRRRRR